MPPKAETKDGRTIQMVATRLGFYGNKRRRPGDQFAVTLRMIDGQEEKAPSWAVTVAEYKKLKEAERQAAIDADNAPALD